MPAVQINYLKDLVVNPGSVCSTDNLFKGPSQGIQENPKNVMINIYINIYIDCFLTNS